MKRHAACCSYTSPLLQSRESRLSRAHGRHSGTLITLAIRQGCRDGQHPYCNLSWLKQQSGECSGKCCWRGLGHPEAPVNSTGVYCFRTSKLKLLKGPHTALCGSSPAGRVQLQRSGLPAPNKPTQAQAADRLSTWACPAAQSTKPPDEPYTSDLASVKDAVERRICRTGGH